VSDFHSQGIRWLFGAYILLRKAVLEGRGFKPRFSINFAPLAPQLWGEPEFKILNLEGIRVQSPPELGDLGGKCLTPDPISNIPATFRLLPSAFPYPLPLTGDSHDR
jgi:hypothetical protein